MNMHHAHIESHDQRPEFVSEAVDRDSGVLCEVSNSITNLGDEARKASRSHSRSKNSPDNSLAWKGLHVLGVGFGFLAVWVVIAWIKEGRFPSLFYRSELVHSLSGDLHVPHPPEFLLAVVGMMGVVAFCMMMVGTHRR